MNRSNKLLQVAGVSLLSVLFLTACDKSATEPKDEIAAGVEKFLSVANQLQTHISEGDAAKIKVDGPELEEAWKTFEDAVNTRYPDAYEQIETYLDPTIAGTQAKTLDPVILAQLDTQLIQAINDLALKAAAGNAQ